MKIWTSELVSICTEEGEKIAMLHQNGEIEIYTLKKASKQDIADLLETNTAQ
jgi:hypothetical protein